MANHEKKILELRRTCTSDSGTYGVFQYQEIPLCVCMELPWRKNASFVSCIPAGCFECTPEVDAEKGRIFRLHNVPGRDGVLIHTANRTRELRGCLAPGLYFGFEGKPGVTSSRKALDAIIELVSFQSFSLQIIDDFSTISRG